MNCSLLTDEEYIDSITEMIPIWTAEGRKDLSDDRSVWEWIKFNIRPHAICHSKRRAKERNERESTLEKEIIRARARWHENGEKSTKYFLNLEKRNHVKNI